MGWPTYHTLPKEVRKGRLTHFSYQVTCKGNENWPNLFPFLNKHLVWRRHRLLYENQMVFTTTHNKIKWFLLYFRQEVFKQKLPYFEHDRSKTYPRFNVRRQVSLSLSLFFYIYTCSVCVGCVCIGGLEDNQTEYIAHPFLTTKFHHLNF